MSTKYINEFLDTFNEIGLTEKGMNRIAFTENESKAKSLFKKICKNEGLSIEEDDIGNVIARREGEDPSLSPVTTGSHLDTVINGGKYDGTAGIVSALEVIRRLNAKKIKTKHPIEIICFTAEESSRFGISTIGSKFMTGKLNIEQIKNVKDSSGTTLKEALENVGKKVIKIEKSLKQNKPLKSFFEVHIEQGPLLENNQKNIGIVTGIASPTRYEILIKGKASHSGTTPMHLRNDAFLGAAELSLAIDEIAKKEADKGTVATVGNCVVSPGAMNVVPETSKIQVDIRGINSSSKLKVSAEIQEVSKQIKSSRNLEISIYQLMEDKPVELDQNIIESIEETCNILDVPFQKMISGAGHDAMHMADICPTGLIFIPCKDGLSHHKEEFTSFNSIKIGCDVLENEIIKEAISIK